MYTIYKLELFEGTLISTSSKKKSQALNTVLSQNNRETRDWKQQMMSKVSQTSRATFSFWWKIVFCCPRCFPLSKGKRKSRRIGQIYSKQLDIERLVSNSIGLRDFLRCYLTTNQRILLAHQRTRVAKESDYSQKYSSETSSDDETAEKYDAEKFKKRMEGF